MLEIKNISKSFGTTVAVDNISLTLEKGAFYGLLGPNGAGKSTTINMLSTVLKPDEGSVSINGFDLLKESQKCKKSIGIVPQEIALYEELSAYDNLMFWGGLYNLSGSALKQNINDTLELMGLSDRKNDKINSYSGGMKRRINIAAALLHRPQLLLMDEPTVGIDPQSRNLIFDVLEKLHGDGMTIIYTTHYMEEAERLCNKIGIIDHGKIIGEGTLDELRAASSTEDVIRIQAKSLNDGQIEVVKNHWKDAVKIQENSIAISEKDKGVSLMEQLSFLNNQEIEINKVEIIPVNLETIFLNLTGRTLRD